MFLWDVCLFTLLLQQGKGSKNLVELGDTADCQEFRCSDNSLCIKHGWVCDGEKDCLDGSDEHPHCEKPTCREDEFRCHSDGSCIQTRWRCDGQRDCQDESDEENCELCSPEHELFLCRDDQKCIPINLVCNGITNCPYDDDEGEPCKEDQCAKVSCDHYCWRTPSGPSCSCKLGFVLNDDRTTCSDVNECSHWPPVCSQRCRNVPGNYSCSCHEGYELDKDGHSCRARGGPPLLFYSTRDQIVSMNLIDEEEKFLHSAAGNIVDLAYDMREKELYWCDQRYGIIYAWAEQSGNPRIVVSNGLGSPEGIDIDWIGRNIYFTDSVLRRVMACSLEGTRCVAIIDEDISQPRSVVVDSLHGYLYWSDWGAYPKIEVCNMDGSQRNLLVSHNITWPNALVLDPASERLYWVDASTDVLECIKIDGTGRHVIVRDNVEHPFSIAVFENYVYWSDWFLNGIMVADKFTGKEVKVSALKTKRPLGLHIHHSVLQQRNFRNPCWNSPCSHVCLLNVFGNFTCACPMSMLLQMDGLQCRPKPDAPFLLVAANTQIVKVLLEDVGQTPPKYYYTGHQESIQAIDYNWEKQKVVYSEANLKNLVLANISAPWHQTVLVDDDLFNVESIAVDWVTNNLYWVDSNRDLIEVARFDNSARRVLLQKIDVGHPTSVAVSPVHQYLFYSSTSPQARIARCTLAGTNCQSVVIDVLSPRSLLVDESSGRIFWVEEFFSIDSSLLNGDDRQRLIRQVQNPRSLAVFNERLYWTERDTGELKYSDKISGGRATSVFTGVEDVSAIIVVHSRGRISVPSPCRINNGGCSDLCFPYQLGVVCHCSAGSVLASDNSTCQRVDTCEAPLFTCGKLCLPAKLLCDGNPDCLLGEDETHCSASHLRALTGQCDVHNDVTNRVSCDKVTWVATSGWDGYRRQAATVASTTCCCQTWPDIEEKHPGPCVGFVCDDGQCVDTGSYCDGKYQCTDHSDEMYCKSGERADCGFHQFACGKDDFCINRSWVCDGTADCEDESDEKDCPEITCAPTQFSCHLAHSNEKRCILRSWRCDGEKDCENGEDEENCDGDLVPHCSEDMFLCHPETHQCIPRSLVCDGYRQCIKGEDEIDCESRFCTRDQYHCKNSMLCISRNRLCDGYNNCPDGSDEEPVMCKYKHITGEDALACKDSFCLNGGTCIVKNKTVVCSCLAGWTGMRCNIKEIVVSYPVLVKNNHTWIAGLLCFIALSVISICGVVCYCKRRRRIHDGESISVIRFRDAMRGETQTREQASVPESYENPGFCDDQDDINANKLPLVTTCMANSPSDTSLDSAFVSRPDGMDVQGSDNPYTPLTNYSSIGDL